MDAKAIWNPGALVLYEDFTCDNWIMKYFNPQTDWKHADFTDRDALADQLREALQSGRSVWVDTTVLGHITSAPDLLLWLESFGELANPWGICSRKHHIQFAQLLLDENGVPEHHVHHCER